MIRTIDAVLDASELSLVREAIDRARFVPGRQTARGAAAEVKRNLQADPSGEVGEASSIVLGALQRAVDFQVLALPAKLSSPIFSRYEVGMAYGRHYDLPRVGGLRADISVTVFLSNPGDYDGGELCIETPEGVRIEKPAAGSAVVYSAGTIHQVAEVSRGIRLAAVVWVQSHVRDERDREILLELGQLSARMPKELEIGRLRSELYRRWCD